MSVDECCVKETDMIEAYRLKQIEEIIEICLNNQLPFFAYCLPNSNSIKIGIQKNFVLKSFKDFSDLEGKEGFVFAPFDTGDKHASWLIRKDFSFDSQEINEDEIKTLKSCRNDNQPKEDKACIAGLERDYFSQIADVLEALKAEELDKAILSRIQNEKGHKELSKALLFIQLSQHYPQAFISFVSLPGVCSWMGASPELLLKSDKDKTETVALAGTLPILNSDLSSLVWGNKEIVEQAMVSDYIESVFKDSAIDKFEKKGPLTVKAGQVAHLKTEFIIERSLSFNDKSKMINALHPTPAVCGLPKQKALELIKAVETHDREYYAGYLGPLEANGDFALYVNLRSMKITENQLSLFVGGGITAESIPQKEWEETQHKAKTLLSVIKAAKLS